MPVSHYRESPGDPPSLCRNSRWDPQSDPQGICSSVSRALWTRARQTFLRPSGYNANTARQLEGHAGPHRSGTGGALQRVQLQVPEHVLHGVDAGAQQAEGAGRGVAEHPQAPAHRQERRPQPTGLAIRSTD